MASLKTQTTPDPVASQTFALVWAALQNTYEGTDITRTVSRLLHMYQPEDGILAYERLLRKLYVLLQDFETNAFRILVSIIPPAVDVPDSIIQEIFQKSTGLIRIIPPFSQSYLNSSNEYGSNLVINNARIDPNQDMIHSSRFVPIRSKGSEKFNGSNQMVPTDSDEFHGFPSNEISSTQICIQNINQFHESTSGNYVPQTDHTYNHNISQTAENSQDQQNVNSASSPIDYEMKWIYTPYLLRKNAISQSTQIYQDPFIMMESVDQKCMDIPMSQENESESTEHYCTVEKCLIRKEPACINSVTEEQEVLNTEKMDLCLEKDVKIENFQEYNEHSSEEIEEQDFNCEMKLEEPKKSNEEAEELLEDVEEKIKRMQRAIQEDIYKMDVVQPPQIAFVKSKLKKTPQYKDLEAEDLQMNKNLKKSIQNFLQRVKPNAPISPEPKSCIQTTQSTVSDETSAFIDDWKKIITRELSSRDLKSSSSDSDKNADVSKENNIPIENTLKKKSEKKVYVILRKSATKPKLESDMAQTTPNLGIQTKSFESNSMKMQQQANSMSESSNYKKQYYDTLLSAQRAQVPVANSVPTSSAASTTEYDSYYYNYMQCQNELMQRQQQLIQRQQQLLLRRQFSNQRPLQTVPNNQDSTSSWSNSNERTYPSSDQLPYPQDSPAVSTIMKPSVFSFWAEDKSTGIIQKYGENECDQVKPSIKRKKSENIVVNLKKTENVRMHQSSSPR